MMPLEFKMWLENCKRDAAAQGLSEEEILVEFLEQARLLTIKQQLKISANRHK